MNGLLKILGCIVLLGLCSCAKQQLLLFKSPTLKQCTLSCIQRYESCSERCKDSCAYCSAQSTYSSLNKEAKYTKQQRIQGLAVNRELNSYRDPLQCLKVSCSCVSDLNACTQACTGLTRKELIAKPRPHCT